MATFTAALAQVPIKVAKSDDEETTVKLVFDVDLDGELIDLLNHVRAGQRQFTLAVYPLQPTLPGVGNGRASEVARRASEAVATAARELAEGGARVFPGGAP